RWGSWGSEGIGGVFDFVWPAQGAERVPQRQVIELLPRVAKESAEVTIDDVPRGLHLDGSPMDPPVEEAPLEFLQACSSHFDEREIAPKGKDDALEIVAVLLSVRRADKGRLLPRDPSLVVLTDRNRCSAA